MKFTRIVSALMFLILASIFVSCTQSPAGFLKSYESFVVSVEKAVENKESNKVAQFSEKAEDFAAKYKEVSKNDKWSKENDAAYAKLSGRLIAAQTKLSALKAKDDISNTLKGVFNK